MESEQIVIQEADLQDIMNRLDRLEQWKKSHDTVGTYCPHTTI